jgi:hypothetical protein
VESGAARNAAVNAMVDSAHVVTRVFTVMMLLALACLGTSSAY